MIAEDGTGNQPDSSIQCTIQRMNLAFANKDPTEDIWFTQLEGEECIITESNIDNVLNAQQEAVSFGVDTGISFARGRTFRYLAVCDGSQSDPPGCTNANVPLPRCSDSDARCVETGADYYAPIDWLQCSSSSTAPEMATRVVITDPTQNEPSTHINVFSCEPTSAGSVTLGFVLCIGGERFQDGFCPIGENDGRTAVFVLDAAFPNTDRTLQAFNQADTIIHEVGHYLGLFHVFGDGGFFRSEL